jgi:O-antigen biosynthesis protein WbqP
VNYLNQKRLFDLILAAFIIVGFVFAAVLLALAIKCTSPGPVLYWSDRIGLGNRIFRMPKFRSMRIDAPTVATHLLTNPSQWMTPIGSFLRRTSLDELPQVWSVLKGDMSFVGPRPALFNEYDLIAMRTAAGIHELVPGITGWAQVNGRDELMLSEKVRLDTEYVLMRSLRLDFVILCKTLLKILRRDGVLH